MYGHPAPRRMTARSPLSLFFILLLLAALFACAPILAACGSDGDAAPETTGAAVTTEAPATAEAPATTAAPVTTQAPATTEAQPAEGTFPVTVTDDNGNSVTIETRPERIVSAAPSNTETLFALGAGERVVGVTSLDDYPPEAATVEKVGDYVPNTEAIMALSPDLVLGYAGSEEALAPVQDAGAAVLIFNPTTVAGIYANITTAGAAIGAPDAAAQLIDSLKVQMEEVAQAAAAVEEPLKVFYAIDNTLWTCGPGSFVDELLNLANAVNVGAMQGTDAASAQPYYQFSPEQLVAADPDVIILPTASGYTSAEEFSADSRFASLTAVKEGRVLLMDDTTVTRPGPRIGEGLKLLASTIYPDIF
ncbi:MAG: ABC transporter substrate-binding protein [Thermoleophilia bacterium]|nr:ABC transporter substrate-binding protein [Thermoleophilia bacterium]